MISNIRPDIARVAEATVTNLKALESQLETLRNDLAWLCQSIGHPEAARVALTPTPSPLSAAFQATPGFGLANGGFAPSAYSPYVTPALPGPGPTSPFAGFVPTANPWQTYAAFGSYAAPFAVAVPNAYTANPFAVSSFGFVNPPSNIAASPVAIQPFVR